MSVSFERNDAATVALQNGAIIAGIETVAEGFKVNRAENSTLPEMGIFRTMQSAQQAIVDFSGDTLASAKTDNAPRERKPRASKQAETASPAKRERKQASASKQAKTETPKPARNVSPVMQRNLDEIAAGNLAVFVTEPEQFSTINSARNLRELVQNAVMYKNGTGNIYPNPAQAKRIAKLLAGTDTALQCELGGYTAWRNSLRKKAVAPASS
jgi:hypothetical protein